jgi:hypothetical protein
MCNAHKRNFNPTECAELGILMHERQQTKETDLSIGLGNEYGLQELPGINLIVGIRLVFCALLL